MEIFHSTRMQHREVWDLLPWLANGTLDETQARRCETHLQKCPECAAEYEAQRALQREIVDSPAVLQTPHASLRKLMAKIDADELVRDTPVIAARPRKVRWLAAAVIVQTVGLISLAGFMTWKLHEIREQPRYATLSSAPAMPSHGPLARVVFDDSTSVGTIANLLRAQEAQIVAGPSEAGVYTLAFANADEQALATVVARMRENEHVRFAEVTSIRSP